MQRSTEGKQLAVNGEVTVLNGFIERENNGNGLEDVEVFRARGGSEMDAT